MLSFAIGPARRSRRLRPARRWLASADATIPSFEFVCFPLRSDDTVIEVRLPFLMKSGDMVVVFFASELDDVYSEDRRFEITTLAMGGRSFARFPIARQATASRKLRLRLDLPPSVGSDPKSPSIVISPHHHTLLDDEVAKTADAYFLYFLSRGYAPGRIVRDWKRESGIGNSILFAPLRLQQDQNFFNVTITARTCSTGYIYSKFYYTTREQEDFNEEGVICFRVLRNGATEEFCFAIPEEAVRTGFLRLRLDALPYVDGTVAAGSVSVSDDPSRSDLRKAELRVLKEAVRREVDLSERLRRSRLPHYPKSLSLELTAGCNLTCSHCSSHGDPAEHLMNNRRASMSVDMLKRIAHEMFPHLTLVNLVGRGEPMMVDDERWALFMRLCHEYDVLVTCVTNGTFLKRRINADNIAQIDTITFSIDGIDTQTFAANRGGADLNRALDAVRYYDRLRRQSALLRRPRLGFSWTLKRNNIAQFPAFIETILPMEPSLLYVRHLFVFRDKDRAESLLGEPLLVNKHLAKAYAMLEGRRIKLDVPPLM